VNASTCGFAHVVKMHASIDASSRSSKPSHHRYNQPNTSHEPVSSVAIWETQGTIKIFSGSHDGYWRLWNTAQGTFVKEFEHRMGGKVETVDVASNFLFVGFEGTTVKVPGVRVGMVHAWNLAVPTDPPIEFQMDPLAPYSAAGCITSFLNSGDTMVSGSHDGTIRIWAYDAAVGGGKGGFALRHTLHGHAGEVTGLAVVGGTMLWSGSTDSTIRLWDMASGECKYLITKETPGTIPPPQQPQAQQQNPQGVGHTGPVTHLVPFESPAGNFVISSSLDGTVKAWNGSNGDCVASETHGQGVVTIALTNDLKGNPILLCGLEAGNIMIRSILPSPNAPALCLLFTLSAKYTAGHEGPVRALRAGPANTFYSGGSDGKLNVWEITGDFGL